MDTTAQKQLITCKVELGALVTAPVWEDHARGRNWLALIAPDPQAPGGIGRTFLQRGRGKYMYMIAGLQPGLAVEFGADYFTGSGTRTPHRWYGVVRQVTPTTVTFERAASSDAAIAAQNEEVLTS